MKLKYILVWCHNIARYFNIIIMLVSAHYPHSMVPNQQAPCPLRQSLKYCLVCLLMKNWKFFAFFLLQISQLTTKIVNMEKTSTPVSVQNAHCEVINCIIADDTGTIALAIWNDLIKRSTNIQFHILEHKDFQKLPLDLPQQTHSKKLMTLT